MDLKMVRSQEKFCRRKLDNLPPHVVHRQSTSSPCPPRMRLAHWAAVGGVASHLKTGETVEENKVEVRTEDELTMNVTCVYYIIYTHCIVWYWVGCEVEGCVVGKKIRGNQTSVGGRRMDQGRHEVKCPLTKYHKSKANSLEQFNAICCVTWSGLLPKRKSPIRSKAKKLWGSSSTCQEL